MTAINFNSLKHLCLLSIALISTSLVGCVDDQPAEEPTEETCEGGKCDDPSTTAAAKCRLECGGDANACFATCREKIAVGLCTEREATVLSSAQRGLTPDAVRWAAADVRGVNTNNRDDRGQEYVEYFAVVAPPPAAGTKVKSIDLGRLTGTSAGATTPLSLTLTPKQKIALEDADNAVAGQCVFTSWHSDIKHPFPACTSATSCPQLEVVATAKRAPWLTSTKLGFTMTNTFLQMKGSINSNGAAVDLANRCMSSQLKGNPADPADILHRPYIRGCMQAHKLFGTEWRNSDPTICAAATRLGECGCGVDTNGDGVADITDPAQVAQALVPAETETTVPLRGFPLGTWSGAGSLPAGCVYANTGDTSKTLVTCDLTAAEILSNAKDVKGLCRTKFGDNVVAHIPVPKAAVVCKPPVGGQYAASCGATPWALGGM
jgi:hypothetical protein